MCQHCVDEERKCSFCKKTPRNTKLVAFFLTKLLVNGVLEYQNIFCFDCRKEQEKRKLDLPKGEWSEIQIA